MPIEAQAPVSHRNVATLTHIVDNPLYHLGGCQALTHPRRNIVEQRLGDFDFVEGHPFEHTGLGGS